MIDGKLLTAEEFITSKSDLSEGGRWVELVNGKVLELGPPDPMHGTAVLNLSKALSVHLQSLERPVGGYPCFELGLLVSRNPDTIRYPAISVIQGQMFAAIDEPFTETPPTLVIEVVSTSRRRHLTQWIEQYHQWGVESVWIIEPVEKQVRVVCRDRSDTLYSRDDELPGEPVLAGFRIPVDELFVVPPGW